MEVCWWKNYFLILKTGVKEIEAPKNTYFFSSIVGKLLKLSTIWKSPLYWPYNCIDRMCERSANYYTVHARTIVADWVGLSFWRKKGNEILLGNSQKCLRQWSVWNFWRAMYRVAKSWKKWNAIQEQLRKGKHSISPLSSNKGDKETEKVLLRKKPGHRLPFDYGDSSDPILIGPTLWHCRPSSQKGTSVKVGTQQYHGNEDNAW